MAETTHLLIAIDRTTGAEYPLHFASYEACNTALAHLCRVHGDRFVTRGRNQEGPTIYRTPLEAFRALDKVAGTAIAEGIEKARKRA